VIFKSQWVGAALLSVAVFSMGLGAMGCGDDDSPQDAATSDDDSGHHESPPHEDSGAPDGSEPEPMDAGRDASEPAPDGSVPSEGGTDGGTPEPDAEVPLMLGGLTVSSTAETLEATLDLFGTAGNRFWVEVSDEQLDRLNADGCCGGGPEEGPLYTPGQGIDRVSNATFADHVLVQDVVTSEVADYGKVEVSLVGQSTFKEFSRTTIPNLRIDTNEFVKGKRIGTFEHFRLNNSLIGTIFREHIVHDVFRALGYPALRSTYAFLGSNVWGDDVWVPMTLIEMYKRRFCEDNQELLGGDCHNMWEFAGDIGNGGGFPGFGFGGGGGFPEDDELKGDGDEPVDTSIVPDDWCQVSDCDNTRLAELMTLMQETSYGPGFKAALADYIDWDRFHQFQCLSWIMVTSDDPIHASNNNVIIERDDGRFVWAPYSVDISTGLWGAESFQLTGQYSVAQACQRDPDCWADTIAVCEDMIARFDELNPEEMVDDTVAELREHNMMRFNDETYAADLRGFFVRRQANLSSELERFRYLPDENGNCGEGLEQCGDGGCGTPEDCAQRVCENGYFFCEASNQCVYESELCPTCTDAAPFFCAWTNQCLADEVLCEVACNAEPEQRWCDALDQCFYYQDYCPIIDDDAGAPWSGGAGGAGGFPIPID
jgi:hypothetical protein